VLLEDDEVVRTALSNLRKVGFSLALDDFGTGYSSLSYLSRFEVDKIKIDRSFVQHLGHEVDSTSLVEAVVMIGRALGLTVTAEGVETNEQRHFLSVAGCAQMQGHLFSRAMPESQIARLLNARERARAA
jgi:EAL domain-containing protein (putative c-di-GMP-specific phosphodiesterase class I)